MTDVQYITQLSRSDLADIRRACNLTPGPAIVIDKLDDGVRISLSAEQLKFLIYSFCRQAWGGLLPSVDIEDIDLSNEVS